MEGSLSVFVECILLILLSGMIFYLSLICVIAPCR